MSREVRLSDRVKQLSFDPSTNAFSLDSAATGFSPFRDFYEDGDVVFYAATDGTRYEVGSGEYNSDSLTRYPLRSSNISSGPYFVDDASSYGATAGKQGHFYPLYLTKSAASGIRGFAGVSPGVHEHRFSGFPGVTFYMPNTHAGHAVPAYHPGVSGENYAVSGGPVDFQGVTEVFVTYPGKSAVFNGAGISGFNDVQPQKAGIAFWGNEQTLDYDADIVWSTGQNAIGVSQPSPEFAIDVGGLVSYSQIRSSGFIDGGSGVQFSGGQALPQSALKTASGGRQLEPFFRNELDTQTHTDQVFSLSGLVDQRLLFKKQLKGQILAGPASGCDESSANCPQDHPMFRYLELEDIPDLSTLYVVQQNYVDYDTDIPAGAVAFTNASGKIEFDKYLKYEKSNNWLGVNIPIAPSYSLDVGGHAGISGMLMVSGDAHFGGDIHAVGNLLVSGTRTFLDSTTVTVKDINLELGSLSGNPITTSATDDSAIDDAGLIIKSKNYDKKWTWKNATDAWTTTEKVDVSGVVFLGDDSVISGAYKPGSGIVIHNVANGHRIDVGNLFYASGTDFAGNSEHLLHQSDRLLVSGVSGIQTRVFGFSGPSGLLEINATALQNNVYDKIDASGNKVSGVLTAADTYLTQRIDASGMKVHDFVITSGQRAVQVASGYATYYTDVSGQVLKTAIDAVAGGYGNWKINAIDYAENAPQVLDSITAGEAVSFSGEKGIDVKYHHSAGSGNILLFDPATLSGWAITDSRYYTDVSGQVLKTAIDAGSFDFATSASGWVKTHVSVTSGNAVHETKLYSDVSGVSISGWANTHVAITSGNLTYGMNVSGQVLKGLIDATNVTDVSGWVGTHVAVNSGNLTYDMNSSGQFVSGIAFNHATLYSDISGVALSGYADGVAGMASALNPNASSGLVNQNGTIDFRHDGSGTLGHLRFDSAVRVGAGAGTKSTLLWDSHDNSVSANPSGTVAIGLEAASGQLNGFQTSGTFIGYRAGYQASGQQNSIYIGSKAGMFATPHRTITYADPPSVVSGEVYNNIGIGENAGRAALEATQLTSIGYNSSIHSSGTTNLIAIGQGAGKLLWNSTNNIAIGNNAGSSSSKSDYNVLLGTNAGASTYKSDECVYIGLQAGNHSTQSDAIFSHSELSENVGIGKSALEFASGCWRDVSIGYLAGQRSSSNRGNINLGAEAGYSGVSNMYCNNIGSYAGYESTAHQFTSFMGYAAGHKTYDAYGTVAIGPYANQSGYKDSHSIYIGHYAGRYTEICEKNVAIGYFALGGLQNQRNGGNSHVVAIGPSAGVKASGVSNSVIIGRNAMNYHDDVPSETVEDTIAIGRAVGKGGIDRRLGSYNLIIEPTCVSNSRHNIWANDYDPYIISIGSVIHGYSSAGAFADGSSQRNIMIGRQPASQSELTTSTLTVNPDRTVDNTLKLNRMAGHAGSLLKVDVTRAGLSFSLSGKNEQEVINSDGYLEIPIAEYKSGSDIYDATGNKIPRNDGTIAIYKPTTGQHLAGREYIVVCLNNAWYRPLDFMTTL